MLLDVYANKLIILYHFLAFLNLSLNMYTLNVHNTGYIKEQTEKGGNKEDRSYTQMHYGFILRNVCIDFSDIFRNSGFKPYLTANADEICPQLGLLLHVWCYKTANKKSDIANMSPTFQALTKSTGKALDQVHTLNIAHSRDIHISPLLPATCAIDRKSVV